MIFRNNRFIGSIFLVAGMTVGGGVLALPLVSVGAGPVYSILILVVIWIFCILSSLASIELNLIYGHQAHFDTIASVMFGKVGRVLYRILILVNGYSLLAAYIAGGAQIIDSTIFSIFNVTIHPFFSALTFTILLAYLVFWGIKAVDKFNRHFTFFELISLLLIILIILVQIDSLNLNLDSGELKYIPMTIPIYFNALAFNFIVPTIANYLKNDYKKICKAFVIGSGIPLILYIFYTLVILSLIPKYGDISFQSIAQAGNNLGDLLNSITVLYKSKFLTLTLHFFLIVAIITSFICVALALFDFLKDIFRRRTILNRKRLVVSILTFLPPLIFVYIYPQGFILALGYAACASALIYSIIPVIMVYKLRYIDKIKTNKKIGSNFLLLFSVFCGGIFIILIEILINIAILPKFI